MRHRFSLLVVLLQITILALCIAACAANAAPAIDNFDGLAHALETCWEPPAGSEGLEITLRFGLTGHGALRGPPMVTYSKLSGPKELQRAFTVSALRAVADCTPVNLTDGFGRIIAQRVLTLRFTQGPKGRLPI